MYKESFVDRIKKARIDAGYTQNQVAEITGISQPILSNLETGEREPSLENLGVLADFYEVSVDWLLGTKGRNIYR
ncbi:MAG: helix-turn-helix transcriptional regulator [Lachnospiraceae bacterium]|nr:helix-turn-helix transcriptional regulator [Lachnospiraceae bacterium]